jgi:hypothetical protein
MRELERWIDVNATRTLVRRGPKDNAEERRG